MAIRFTSTALLALLALAAGSTGAAAATISYATRPMDDFTIPAAGAYKAWWEEQAGTVNSNLLADFNGATAPAGTGNSYATTTDDVFSHLTVTFNIPTGQTWLFQIAPDAGYGAAIYFNGAASPQDVDGSDQWWGGSWADSAEIIGSSATAGAGFFDAYWAEDCCNGPQGGRFSTDGGATWQDLSVANLEAAAVPVPAAIWLLASAMAGLIGIGRRRTA